MISVIIPHLNQPDDLEACLRSLGRQALKRSSFEVVVVDNGSEVLPDTVVGRFPGTILVQELRAGPGLARNRGVAASSGEVLAFIDADCRAHPDWLRSGVHALQASPARTILGGDVQIWRQNEQTITSFEAYESVFAYRFKLYIEQHGFSGTGNLVVRRSDFEEIGPFRGIDVAEDIDWGQRARTSGYTFAYVPEMIVYHPARRSFRELFIKWDRHIQHAVNTGGWSALRRFRWLVRAIGILVSPLVDWTKVVASNRIEGPAARLKAILVLVVVRAYRAYKMIELSLSTKGVVWNRDMAISETDVRHSHD